MLEQAFTGDAVSKRWRQSNIEEICDILDHLRKPITKRNRVEGPHPYYGATSLLDHVEGYLFDEPLVLVGEDGAKWDSGENSAFAIEGKCWVNNHAHVLRPLRETVLDAWIIYFLNHSDLTPFTTGLTVPKLNQGKLKEIPIPLPPLPEQEQIVAILDAAFTAIATATANTKKNIANARALFENQLDTYFSIEPNGKNELSCMEGLCDLVNYGYTASAKTDKSEPKFLRITDIQDGVVDWESVPSCDCGIDDQEKYRLASGDIVFARTGATTGKSFLIVECPESAVFASYLIRIRPRKGVRPDYLAYYFYSPMYWEQISKSVSGSAQPGVNASKLKKLRVPLPPLPEQKRIVATLDKVSANTASLVRIGEQKLTHLAELKQSLLHRAFTGELTADFIPEAGI